MNSVSPYAIRCFDPNKKAKKRGDNYSPLGSIGQFDTYNIFKDFINGKGGGYHLLPGTKQIYRFASIRFDDAKRIIFGVFQVGTYGVKANIINIKTGAVDFERAQDNAEITNHYISFFVPQKLNEGVVILHSHRGVGIKTIIYGLLADEFKKRTGGRVLQMNPLAFKKAFQEWQGAVSKEIKLVGYKAMGAAEDQIAKLGHKEVEAELVIKSPRKANLGSLSDFFNPASEQHAIVEVLSEMCTHVKTIVEHNGRKRTFRLGSSPDSQVCEIDVDESKVPVSAGNPDMPRMHAWCKILLNDILASVYPGMGIRV